MYLRRLQEITPAIVIPAILGVLLICGVASFFVVLTTPEGMNPIEGLGLRIYLLRNDSALNKPLGTDPSPIRFEVETGETANTIGIKLVTEGIISNGTLFARYARFEGLDDDLRPGVFYLNKTMTIPQIAKRLTDPTPTTVRILIRENMRMEEIAETIDNTDLLDFTGEDFLAVVRAGAPIPDDFRVRYGIPAGASLEGFLYPATYEIELGMSALEFRDLLLETFEASLTQDIIDEATLQGRTIYQVVTLASIVEKETVLETERPLVASVYLNRLAIGQKLDADPTVQYQKRNNLETGPWWPSITLDDYSNVVGPYNTYLNAGMPPGPIVSPGLRSIRAVVRPTTTNYLYFQASCEGGGKHEFFDTLAAHQQYYELRLNGCQ